MSAPSEMASFDTMIPEKPPLQLAPAASGLTSALSTCASAMHGVRTYHYSSHLAEDHNWKISRAALWMF